MKVVCFITAAKVMVMCGVSMLMNCLLKSKRLFLQHDLSVLQLHSMPSSRPGYSSMTNSPVILFGYSYKRVPGKLIYVRVLTKG